ncbi:MAG: hypothetical protein PHN79_09445 [Methanoregula sp.]|nr:hypothetical protein [Methanoregula sp.]
MADAHPRSRVHIKKDTSGFVPAADEPVPVRANRNAGCIATRTKDYERYP